MTFNIALAQVDAILGDIPANVETHVRFATRAREAGADLVVFPELSLTGYSVKDLNWELAVTPGDALLEPLREVSRSITVIAGGIEEGDSFAIFNSAFLFEKGAARSAHRKVYPPTYGMFEESRYFSRGTQVQPVDTGLGRLGVLICEDMWHVSLPYLMAMQGAQVLIALVASPTRMGTEAGPLRAAEVNRENHSAYARLLSVYVASCNRVGFEDGVNFWGGSGVVGPDGSSLVSARLFDEDLVVATLDDNEVRRARRFSRHFLDEDPFLVQRELSHIGARGF